MTDAFLQLHAVTFQYDSATEPLFEDLSLVLDPGFTGVVGRNGCGKSTLLRILAGELAPTRGQVERRGAVAACWQSTEAPPPDAGALLDANDAAAWKLRGRLGIELDWLDRFDTLSHGERKRLQVGAALYREPAILVVDEPTNHLDRTGRDFIARALLAYRGLGVIVSHDRELLDRLCRSCLFLGEGAPRLRPGGYSDGRVEAERERAEAGREHERARQEVDRIEREAVRRRESAARASRRLSKRGIDPKDHDAKAKIDAARVSGRDTAAGRRLRQLDGRRERARDELGAAAAPPSERLGVTWSGERAARDLLMRLPAGEVSIGEDRALSWPEIEIGASDRIALIGDNGAGKSTLIAQVMARLDLPSERLVVLPQQIEAEDARRVVEEVRALPNQERGAILSTLQRLGSDPRRVLETDAPSPGELRKLLFARGAAGDPWLIVMDEPTNHLDLPSVECLQAALADFRGALLLVSHDHAFLGALTDIEWRIDDGALGVRRLDRAVE